MSILISLIFVFNYDNLVIREKLLYLVALLLSTFLYSFRRYSRLAQKDNSDIINRDSELNN